MVVFLGDLRPNTPVSNDFPNCEILVFNTHLADMTAVFVFSSLSTMAYAFGLTNVPTIPRAFNSQIKIQKYFNSFLPCRKFREFPWRQTTKLFWSILPWRRTLVRFQSARQSVRACCSAPKPFRTPNRRTSNPSRCSSRPDRWGRFRPAHWFQTGRLLPYGTLLLVNRVLNRPAHYLPSG